MFKITITNIKDPTRSWGATFQTMEELNSWVQKAHHTRVGRRLEREVLASSESFDESDVISERFVDSEIGGVPTQNRYVTLCAEATYVVEDITIKHNQAIVNQAAKQFLNETDFQVTRHRDQLAAGTTPSLNEFEVQALLLERQNARNSIHV